MVINPFNILRMERAIFAIKIGQCHRELGNHERVRVTDLMDDTTLLVEPLQGALRAEEG